MAFKWFKIGKKNGKKISRRTDKNAGEEIKIDKKTGEALLLCPRCRVYMEKLKKNNIIIDVCSRCGGMWADAGEMEKLYQFHRKFHKKEVEKHEKAKMAKRKKHKKY